MICDIRYIACKNNHGEFVSYLLENKDALGLNDNVLNEVDSCTISPLMAAVINSSEATVNVLCDYTYTYTHTDNNKNRVEILSIRDKTYNNNAIDWAVHFGNVSIFAKLSAFEFVTTCTCRANI